MGNRTYNGCNFLKIEETPKKKIKYRKKTPEEKIKDKQENVKYSIHHILSKYNGGSNEDINLINLKINKHRHLHNLYGPATPIEQLEQWLEINEQVFTEEVRNKILDIIFMKEEEIYKSGVKK